jgi:putative methanogenesis marker protein 6
MKQYTPSYVGSVTKYVFIDSPDMTPQNLAIRAYEISGGAMIKETCFGLQVTGKPDEVDRIVASLREMDPTHIFVKDRGFPPGDPRRCRADLGGARPGYYGHEYESGLLRYVSRGLAEVALPGEEEVSLPEPGPRKKQKLDVGVLKKLIDAEEP